METLGHQNSNDSGLVARMDGYGVSKEKEVKHTVHGLRCKAHGESVWLVWFPVLAHKKPFKHIIFLPLLEPVEFFRELADWFKDR